MRVYFWRKARKALKKVLENRKKYRKCGRKPENAILESQKVEKNLWKAGKSILVYFLRKARNRPPIPGPPLYKYLRYTRKSLLRVGRDNIYHSLTFFV